MRCKSDEELEAMETLDYGDPVIRWRSMGMSAIQLPHSNALGDCCGTDCRRIEAICTELVAKSSQLCE
jgi:hypothetical protein